MERAKERKFELFESVFQISQILGRLGYHRNLAQISKDGLNIGFWRELSLSGFPRFHIILHLPFESNAAQFTSFHLDQRPHRAPSRFFIHSTNTKALEVGMIKTASLISPACLGATLLRSAASHEELFGTTREIKSFSNNGKVELSERFLSRRKSVPIKNRERLLKLRDNTLKTNSLEDFSNQ